LHAAHQDGQDEGPEMTAKFMVRFYAMTFNKISALFNGIHVDIRSKSEAHKLIKIRFRSIGPAPAFHAVNFLHFLLAKPRRASFASQRRVGMIALAVEALE